MKRILPLAILLLLLGVESAVPCFGPKLFLGVPDDNRGRVLAELTILYVKEKTGVETVRVAVAGDAGITGVRGATLDLALSATAAEDLTLLLAAPGGPFLLSGPRVLTDLQFSTVPVALKKLGALLNEDFFAGLVAEVEEGAEPAAAVGRALRGKRWI
jgi:hypothetical protein